MIYLHFLSTDPKRIALVAAIPIATYVLLAFVVLLWENSVLLWGRNG